MLAALVAAVCIAACGGSSNSSTTSKNKTTTTSASTKTATTSRAALAACLKKHGVTLPSNFGNFHRRFGTGTGTTPFTPPAGSNSGGGFPGGGGPGASGGGFFGRNSKFATAFKDCGAKFGAFGGRFRGGFTGGGRFRPSTQVLDSYVACLRKNGDPSMPEPYSTSKTTPFPLAAEATSGFKTANPKCESIVFKAFRNFAPPRSTGQTTTTANS